MKKTLILFIILFSVQHAFSQATTPLDDAHSRLEKELDAETLKEIDSLKSMDDMDEYHFSLGMYIRNEFGLWKADSELHDYLVGLGMRHPDDMSSVILESFWCRRHGVEYDLAGKVKKYAEYWESVEAKDRYEKERYRRANEFIRNGMADLEVESADVPVLNIPRRTEEGESRYDARYLCRTDDGVYVSVRKWLGNKNWRDIYGSVPYLIDLDTNEIRPIECPELDEILSSVQIGDVLWIYGKKNGAGKLVSLKRGKSKTVGLPSEEENPVLGICSGDLIAVYSRTVYRLSSSKWKIIFTSEEDIPKSVVPPQVIDGVLYIRDEGVGGNCKSLWLVDLKSSRIESFHAKTGLVGPYGPRWENNFSYSADGNGNLYVTAGEGYSTKSLIRILKNGSMEFLIYESEIKGYGSQYIDSSALTASSDGSVLIAGHDGLYRLTGNKLCAIVRFRNAKQQIPLKGGNVHHWTWHPSAILELGADDYLISGDFGGTYRVKKTDGTWEIIVID